MLREEPPEIAPRHGRGIRDPWTTELLMKRGGAIASWWPTQRKSRDAVSTSRTRAVSPRPALRGRVTTSPPPADQRASRSRPTSPRAASDVDDSFARSRPGPGRREAGCRGSPVRKRLLLLHPHDEVGVARLVLEGHEDDPGSGRGTLAIDHEARDPDELAVSAASGPRAAGSPGLQARLAGARADGRERQRTGPVVRDDEFRRGWVRRAGKLFDARARPRAAARDSDRARRPTRHRGDAARAARTRRSPRGAWPPGPGAARAGSSPRRSGTARHPSRRRSASPSSPRVPSRCGSRGAGPGRRARRSSWTPSAAASLAALSLGRTAALQRAVPWARRHVHRSHLHAMLARIAHELRGRVEPHRLAVEQRAVKQAGS